MPEKQEVIDWLVSSDEPWVVLNTRLDLLGQGEGEPEVKAAYQALKKNEMVADLLDDLKIWPQTQPLGRAYDPKDSPWKLSMLADFGLKREDKRVADFAAKVFANQATAPVPSGFLHGGFDHTRSWDKRPYVCVSHVMTYALARFGYLGDARLDRAYEYLEEWQRLDGGWHPTQACLPGESREDEPSCPFGTVNVLRAVAANPVLRKSKTANRGVENVLTSWERRKEPYRPVGFGMGTTFGRLQYPFVQHQLLKTVDTLANFPAALGDKRFGEMLDVVTEKHTPDGFFKPEGVNKPFAEFDFGQKKVASPWITFLVTRASQRFERFKKAPAKKSSKKQNKPANR
jgi:hypothetical protein